MLRLKGVKNETLVFWIKHRSTLVTYDNALITIQVLRRTITQNKK